MVLPDFFGEGDCRNPHHYDSENWWLQVVASHEDTCNQNDRPSTLSFPLSSVYYHYFHTPKRYPTDCGELLLVFINLPLIAPSPMNTLVQFCSHLPKNYGEDIWVGLLLIPHQTSKWNTSLAHFGFKSQQKS